MTPSRPASPPAVRQPQAPGIASLIEQNREQIEKALPKHVTVERMMRVALTEFRKSGKLQQCDPVSFLGAVVQAAQLGLEPGGALGHCYLIPYGKECQLQIGYRGMIDLARRSGNIVSISARAVYNGDKFEISLGTDDSLVHVPAFKTKELQFVYAVAKLKDGGVQFDVMSVADVEQIRDKHTKNSDAWRSHFDEMAKKTVVRRLFKLLPVSIEIRDAMRAEEDQYHHKIIDPGYEIPIARHDPARIAAVQAAGAESYGEADLPAAKQNLIGICLDLKDRGGSWEQDSGSIMTFQDWSKQATLADHLVMADKLSKAKLK